MVSKADARSDRGQVSPALPRGWLGVLLSLLVIGGILNFILPEVFGAI